MKSLEKARKDLEKAIERRDQAKQRLEAEEYSVKECEAALTESENNEFIGTIREWKLTVEELKDLKKALSGKSLAEVLSEKEEMENHEEFIDREQM